MSESSIVLPTNFFCRYWTSNAAGGKSDNIDFVASDIDGRTYYQISASVLEAGTLARELAPLKKIPDNHLKLLLVLDEIGTSSNYEDIRQVNLLHWLLGE